MNTFKEVKACISLLVPVLNAVHCTRRICSWG